METGIQADAKRSVRVIFRLDGFTLTHHPRLPFDVSYHVPRLGVSRESRNKDTRAAVPFSYVDTFEPSACRFKSTGTARSSALPRPVQQCMGVTEVRVSARRQAVSRHWRRSPVHWYCPPDPPIYCSSVF